jgi:hypothetical protein
MSDGIRVWLVERTFSDDEQNLVVLTYATPDGRREFRKERALTTFSDDRTTRVSLDVDERNLSAVGDPETRQRYADEVERTAATHDPGDSL